MMRLTRKYHKILAAVLLFALTACGGSSEQKKEGGAGKNPRLAPSQAKKIVLKGSDTGLPISQKIAEEYMTKNPDLSITAVGGGSGVGISALMSGTTDIAISSRELKDDEKKKLENAKINVKEAVIGYDALAVIVHPNNPIKQLTREQIEDIYTGKVTNWKEVGGKDGKIILYSRESSSGTFEFFKEHVLNKKNYATTALMLPASGGVVQSVSQNEGGIGYVGIAYVNPNIKALGVSYDQGKTFVAPSIASAKDKTYPISRPLYFFYPETLEEKVKPLIDYTVSAEGQKQVEAVGYVPVR